MSPRPGAGLLGGREGLDPRKVGKLLHSVSKGSRDARVSYLVAAMTINLSLGVLYGWSLFLAPLEESLQVSRASLSLVPALGLLCFTLGVLCHDALVRRLGPPRLALAVAAVAGLGHLAFGLAPSYVALLLGYGVAFGSAAGVGYGLALALARLSFRPARGWAVGVSVASFAAGGMAVSALGAAFGVPRDVAGVFAVIGAAFFLEALVLSIVLRAPNPEPGLDRSPAATVRPARVRAGPLLRLAAAYFAFSYLGLVLVAHGAPILGAFDVAPAVAALAPFVLNLGYIAGAVTGGMIAARAPHRATPLAFLLALTAAVGALGLPVASPVAVLAIFVVGIGFGSTVSVFVMLLTVNYGAERTGFLFGRLNLGYGLAGFLAPWITGWLYELNGDYATALWFAGLLGILGSLALAGIPALRSETPERSRLQL